MVYVSVRYKRLLAKFLHTFWMVLPHTIWISDSKSFFIRSTDVRVSRLSSDWESTRLKIELSPVQIREAAFLSRTTREREKSI